MEVKKSLNLEEGEIFFKWLGDRLLKKNKNVITAELGPTGSGKSYRDLRKAELWYKLHFKEDFPTENICFGVKAVMNLLNSKKLRTGEVIIFEEAGVNLGSRDFQTKISKMFNYVLQSFRSMNLALFMNLPYLSMLDSQARHLLHYYSESVSINKSEKTNTCKPFFVQIAQGTGKVYRKYPKVRTAGGMSKVKRFKWGMPSEYLVKAYEKKKQDFLDNLFQEVQIKAGGKEEVKSKYQPWQIVQAMKVKNLREDKGLSFYKIEDELGISRRTASKYYDIALNLPEK